MATTALTLHPPENFNLAVFNLAIQRSNLPNCQMKTIFPLYGIQLSPFLHAEETRLAMTLYAHTNNRVLVSTNIFPVVDPGGDPRVPRIPPFSLELCGFSTATS